MAEIAITTSAQRGEISIIEVFEGDLVTPIYTDQFANITQYNKMGERRYDVNVDGVSELFACKVHNCYLLDPADDYETAWVIEGESFRAVGDIAPLGFRYHAW